MKIEQVDENFIINANITEPDIVWYNVREAPFEIRGIMYDESLGRFLRFPQNVAKTVSEDVTFLNTLTSGGRVRFKTDSSYIAIHTVMDGFGSFPHMPITGKSGFDIYRMADGKETFFLVMGLYTVDGGNDCFHQKGFVNVYATTNRINNFQIFFFLNLKCEEEDRDWIVTQFNRC